MSKPVNTKTRMIMVRLTPEQSDELTRVAELKQKKVTAIIREMIDFGLQNIHRPKLSRADKAFLKANFESLFILRQLANRVEPTISQEAQKDAQKSIQAHFETEL